MRNLAKIRKSLTPVRRAKIEAMSARIMDEEPSLRDLRRALNITQVNLAKTLGIGQDGVSRLEQRSDLRISTLRAAIEAMGGRLELIAKFPNRPPVSLSGLSEIDAGKSKKGR